MESVTSRVVVRKIARETAPSFHVIQWDHNIQFMQLKKVKNIEVIGGTRCDILGGQKPIGLHD